MPVREESEIIPEIEINELNTEQRERERDRERQRERLEKN